MKNKSIQFFTLFVLFVMATGCSNNEISGSNLGLSLDNGTKWKANAETHEGMTKMQEILANHADSEEAKLHELLSEQTSYIIRNCDMDGEAHDQLHNVLHPMLNSIDGMKNASSKEVKTEAEKLRAYLKVYFEYFKT